MVGELNNCMTCYELHGNNDELCLECDQKEAMLLYQNVEFTNICKDRKFWDKYYEKSKDYSVGYFAELRSRRSRHMASRCIKKTIEIYKNKI